MQPSHQDGEPRPTEGKEADKLDDPRRRRGPPQRLEDTDASGDAYNDTGDENQRQKTERDS